MKNKLRKLFFLSVLTGVTLLTTIGFADTNATPENHAMGSSLIQQEQEQSESPQSASPRLRSFAAAAPAVANSLVDLSPTDANIPSCDAVDVASYQSWMKQEDFNGLKAQGVKTIVVKLSEGTYYTNPYASAQIKMAQNAGLNIATYHYAIFGNTNNQTTANHAAIAEADYYAQAAQKLGLSTAITMVEDAENSGTTSSVWTQASQNFQSELSKKGYHNVKFYTGQSWAANGSMNSSTLGAKNFWVAQYLYGKPETNPTGWANTLKNNAQFGAWQYTSQMRYSGTSLQKNVLDTSTDFSNFFSARYIISFDTNGGSTLPNQTVGSLGQVKQPTNPSKTGATFSGWYSDAALTQVYDFSTRISSNKTLYAKWTPSPAPSISYQTQVQNIGWQTPSYNGETAGTSGQGLRAEALKISLVNLPQNLAGSHVQYQSYIQGIGWQNTIATDGTMSGTQVQSKRLEAFRLKLTGAISQQFDIYYRVHAQNIGWMAWTKDWQTAGTTEMSYRLEAVQIQLVKKGDPAPSTPGSSSFSYFTLPTIQYSTHIQKIAWQSPVINGATSGTTGKALRIEAVKINLENLPTTLSAGLSYRSQIQNIGWQDWVSQATISGTTGLGLRDESIQIKLTGEISKYFNVSYRAHVQGIGWQDWVSNGDTAGTIGKSLRMEALEIQVLPK